MIGRDRELDVPTGSWTVRSPARARILLVRGEAGIGKSALLDWIEEHAARRGMATRRVAGSPAAETARMSASPGVQERLEARQASADRWSRAAAQVVRLAEGA